MPDRLDLVAAAVTSMPPRSPMDVAVTDWKTSGLRRASTVRLSRLDCLEQSLLIGRIGEISKNDAEKVREAWATYIKPQF
jgi:mRNA interferase MazF